MHRLNHLLEFLDTDFWLIRVSRISTLWNVIVHRVVAPIILRLVQSGFVYRTIVVAWQNVDSVNAKLFQMFDGPRLCKCHEFAWVLGILAGDGEVAMMHLVDNQIGRRLGDRTFIAAPMFRIGFRHIDDGSALAVNTYGFGEDTRALALTHIEGIELPHQVALDGCRPLLVT